MLQSKERKASSSEAAQLSHLTCQRFISYEPTLPRSPKRRFSYSNYDDSEVSITYHHHTKRPTRSDCMACKGGTYCERPLRRSPLAQISANQKGHSKRRNTFYGCTECNVALCKEGLCFNRYHRISSN